MQGNPKQQQEAAALVGRVQLAVEHMIPRGCSYVVALVKHGEGAFGTVAANVDKREQLELLQGLVAQLQTDAIGGIVIPGGS